MAIKHIQVMKEEVNHFIRCSVDDDARAREIVASLFITCSIRANSYKGFRYLRKDEVQEGFTYGMNEIIEEQISDTGVVNTDNLFDGRDRSRVSFY